jgi:ketosteroid isomerase-like protein
MGAISTITVAAYRRGLAATERGDLDSLLGQFHPDCTFTFTGDSPLGARLRGLPDIRRWFERFGRLLPHPRFDIRRTVVSGPLWNQQLAAHVLIRSTIDNEPYDNQFAHFLRLRWGKVVDDLVVEDTQQWERGCRRLLAAGVGEAAAAPLGHA